jgi:hypothetical protein
MLDYKIKADYFGAMAGVLCLFHCMATPFLFLAKACSTTCCADAPVWWKFIDYLFIAIAFGAIYYATRNTNKYWIQIALWSAWGILLFAILNESVEVVPLPEELAYIPALVIVGLHLYNHKYCKCTEGECCIK